MIRAFRLCKTRHLAAAFTGEGARLAGGRWNSPGLPMVYTSASLSLATLEVMVHLEDPETLAKWFSWIAVEFPEDAMETFPLAKLAPSWLDDETGTSTRNIGDTWLRSRRSLVLAVPSVVTPGEWNYLINPGHPRFTELATGRSQPFRPDPRLLT
jgi:RES domain-containing protein